MNFYERQEVVRRASRRLVIMFIVAVIAIVAVVDLVAVIVFGGGDGSSLVGIIIFVSFATGLMIGLASLIRSLMLRSGGGGKVARSLGGVYVPEDTRDPSLRRLRNVVEEMAIAAGTPVPEVYVLENEPGINAFAAGWSPADAAVAVTRGSLNSLNRDELQGVIGHEFSHVVNGDMRLNIRLMGLLFGILVLAIVGRFMMWGGAAGGGRRNSSAGQLALVGIAAMAAGYIGVLAGRIIKAAVSRQREYLADASAVQYTRQTSGLVGALKKIGGLPTGSQLKNGKVEDVSHMLFGNGLRLSSMFATHPPLPDRIKALDPSYDPAELQRLSQQWAVSPPSGMAEDHALGLDVRRGEGVGQAATSESAAASPAPAPGAQVPVSRADVATSVGTIPPDAYERAGAVMASIPDDVLERARQLETAVPLIFGLLLSEAEDVRTPQHAVIAHAYGRGVADTAWHEGGVVSRLDPSTRLPLAELAFGVVRHQTQPDQQRLLETINALVQVDGVITVSEFCLSRLLTQELHEAAHHGQVRSHTGRRRLARESAASAALLGVLASVSGEDSSASAGEDPVSAARDSVSAAAEAFSAGISHLYPEWRVTYQPLTDGVTVLDSVLPVLDQLRPHDKQRLVEAMVAVIERDGVTTVAELELVRTLAALLHCPLPVG